MIRDEEFKRLLLYAKGLGLKVTIFNKLNEKIIAEWALDGTEITIYKYSKMSKTELILSLVHELGHMLDFIHKSQRKPSAKVNAAWDREHDRKDGEILPESARKIIYEDEAAGITWWDVIFKDCNIKISPWKIEVQKELDLWVYEYFYKNGVYPNEKISDKKLKELRAKHKP